MTLSPGDSRVVQAQRRRGRVEDVLTARGRQYVLAILLALVIGGGAPTPTDTPTTPGLTTGSPPHAHYRIRALLYAGKPNWTLLATLTPR